MPSKQEQEMRELAEAEGLIVDKIAYGRHMKVYVSTKDGRRGIVVAPKSPSDYRQLKNKRADFRKFARGQPLGQSDEQDEGD